MSTVEVNSPTDELIKDSDDVATQEGKLALCVSNRFSILKPFLLSRNHRR